MASGQANGALVGETQVFVTRDCTHFRPLLKSPIASIASRLFALLRGDNEASIAARRAFGHCVLDHALPVPTASNYSLTVDSQIKQLFSVSPPVIACVQGPLKVDFLHAQKANCDKPRAIINGLTSTPLTSSNSAAMDLHNIIFFGFTLHNELVRCSKEDPDQYARFCYFYLCALVHETAHWVLTKVHGFRTDVLRRDAANKACVSGTGLGAAMSISQAGQTKPDYLITLGQRPDDAGARATDMLIGATSKVVSFADGDTEVVRRGFSPRITEEPAILSQSALLELLGIKSMPKMEDVTGEAPILIGGPIPKWSSHDNYLVTSQSLVNSYCAHGITRVGELFN